jgi:glucose uptake protein
MAIPTTYWAALLLAILTMLCWGSWANTMKLAGSRWRFELYYYDYALGVFLLAVLAAFTLGTIGADITVMDNLTIVRKRQIAYVLVAGAVFNLANMLLVSAISVAGMAVAFPIGIGLALVIGVIWSYLIRPQANPYLLFSGAGVVVLAIVVTAMAYAALQRYRDKLERQKALAEPAKRKPVLSRPSPVKGVVLSLFAGVLMGSFYPLVEMGRNDDIEMGPYPIGLVFGAAVLATTFFFNIFFTNLPVQGAPISMLYYFRGTMKQHVLGIAGGMMWCAGTIANFAAASAPKEVQVGPAVAYALGQGATLISMLWGLFYWKETAGAPGKITAKFYLTLVLYVVGLVLISIAPLFAQ